MSDFRKDYYAILGLSPGASNADIKRAYRKLVKQYHPDLHGDQASFGTKMTEINEAYEVLGNEDERKAYDAYLENKLKLQPSVQKGPAEKNKRTYTKTVTVDRENRCYLKGTLCIKFKGVPENRPDENIFREISYNLKATEISAIINRRDIGEEGVLSLEFREVFEQNKKISIPLDRPVSATVIANDGTAERYLLDLNEVRVPSPEIVDVTKHEGDSYGTLTGVFYAYIRKVVSEEKDIEVTECFGETGHVEEKFENGIRHYRKQYYHVDCSTYWGDWIIDTPKPTTIPTGRTEKKGAYSRTEYYYSDRKKKYWGNWVYQPVSSHASAAGCAGPLRLLIGLILAGIFLYHLLPALLFIVPFFVLIILLQFVPPKVWTGIVMVVISCFVLISLAALISLFTASRNRAGQHNPAENSVTTNYEPVKKNSAKPSRDTLVVHDISWKDYDGRKYQGRFWVKKSAVTAASKFKNELDAGSFGVNGYAGIVSSLKEHDSTALNGVYGMLDSIRKTDSLSAPRFAETVVSLVQSIPYTLILPQDCNPDLYHDPYISTYLNSPSPKCEGFQRFGINSPVEFLGSLHGDCDTRTLLLYSILSHYGYRVAMLSSEHYNHSLLGIDLPFDGAAFNDGGQRYVLWETTYAGIQPGLIAGAVANLDYWKITIKSN
ncbi:DnaJ domain-containing protein [Pedobacter sp. HMF7647]|uniref:DnaJ domain-containing protein n=1 Tax=Hufsiella arboris TaxID=2695275 RepID=A0A7K1Y8C9_9SPHI|nr:DnaJ domain-containing protein [Hufsiella arboris]MXV50339.1 DnaJ domain-containing protein [Hufsiella arboris]